MSSKRALLTTEEEEQITGGTRYVVIKNSSGGWTMKSGTQSRQYDELSDVVAFLKRHPHDSYTCPTDAELLEVEKAYGSPVQMWRYII